MYIDEVALKMEQQDYANRSVMANGIKITF